MRTILLLVAALVVLQALVGCGSSRETTSNPAKVRELSYAELALRRGDADMAIDRLQALSVSDDQHLVERRRLLLAEAYIQEQDLDAAVQALGQNAMSSQHEPRRQLVLGQVALRQARFFDAQVHAREAAVDLDGASLQAAKDLEAAARSLELLASLDAPGAKLDATLEEVRTLMATIHDPTLKRSVDALVN